MLRSLSSYEGCPFLCNIDSMELEGVNEMERSFLCLRRSPINIHKVAIIQNISIVLASIFGGKQVDKMADALSYP